jgi:hypothetical protein
MSAYKPGEEEDLRSAELVREWTASGLLSESQQAVLAADLVSELKTLHPVFRALLFLFSGLILLAFLSLAGMQVRPRENESTGLFFAIFAILFFVVAWLLATGLRLFRCGAEEVATVLSVLLGAVAVGFTFADSGPEFALVIALCTAAIVSLLVHTTFGLRYMGVAAVIFGGIAPFALNAGVVQERLLSVLIFAVFFFASRKAASVAPHSGRGSDYLWMRATAWAGIYAALHQRWPALGLATTSGVFYWLTYAAIWVIPAIGIWLAVRERDRVLLDISAVLALITLTSNKPYLGWERQAWDPILLGLLLIGLAVVLRRWLESGVKASRSGFTAKRLLSREARQVEAAAIVSLAIQQPDVQIPKSESGGRSGGAGASGNF